MAAAAILKNRKILISSQPIDQFQKSKMAPAAILKIYKNRNISTIKRPILTKFGTVMDMDLQTVVAI